MPVADRAMVRAPVVHDAVDVAERALARQLRHKPGGRPGLIGAFDEGLVNLRRDIHGPALGDLKDRPLPLDHADARHGHRHAALRQVAGRETAAAEVLIHGLRPGRRLKALLDFRLGDLPERLHCGLALDGLLARAVEGGCAGVDQMDQAGRRSAGELVAGDPLDRIRTPEGPHVGENLGGVGQEVSEQHADTVQAVILRSHHIRGTSAIPVERRVQDGFHEVPIRKVVGPLALALEPARDGVMPERFLSETELGQAGIADHQVAGDHRHLDACFPLLIPPLGIARLGVDILAFLAVLAGPGVGLLEFLGVVDLLVDAPGQFAHVHTLDAHPEVVLKKRLVHDRPGDSHRNAAQREIGLAAHGGHSQTGLGETEELLLHIGRNRGVARILDIPAIDPEGWQTLLAVPRQNGGQIHGTRALGSVESPDRLGYRGIHIHRLAAIAPAGGHGQRHAHALTTELIGTGGGFSHPADAGVGDDALHRLAIRPAQVGREEFCRRRSHGHHLFFK